MFDISWFELMLVAVVALVVIGPKDLPRTLRSIAQWVRRGRQMMTHFRSGIDDMMREAELDELRQQASNLRNYNIKDEAGRMVDPTGDVQRSVEEAVREAEREAENEAPSIAPAEPAGAAAVSAESAGSKPSGAAAKGSTRAKPGGQAKAAPETGTKAETDDPAEAGGPRD